MQKLNYNCFAAVVVCIGVTPITKGHPGHILDGMFFAPNVIVFQFLQ